MMRSILMTIMLIIVAVVMYSHVFGQREGFTVELQQQGHELNGAIERINLYGEGAMR